MPFLILEYLSFINRSSVSALPTFLAITGCLTRIYFASSETLFLDLIVAVASKQRDWNMFLHIFIYELKTFQWARELIKLF